MTRELSQLLVVGLVAMSTAACRSQSPTAPTPTSPNPTPQPTLMGLLVSQPPSLIVVGASVQLHATARFSDGSIQTVQPQWSATGGSAEITSTGLLTARQPGTGNVTARYQGFETHKTVAVVLDYSGTWRGPWRRLECFGPRCHEGDFANPFVELLISQHSSTVDALSAVLSFGPWEPTRYVLSGRGFFSITRPVLGFSLLERGPNGERLREISMSTSDMTIDATQRLSARMTMMFTEGEERTRLEFSLENLSLISRAVRLDSL